MKLYYKHTNSKIIHVACVKRYLIFYYLIFALTGLLFIHVSCTNEPNTQKISQGAIEYDIEYLDDERENPLIMLLPREMVTTFSDNSTHTLIEGVFGTFKMTYISNYQEKKNYTLLQIMDKKYVYQTNMDSLAFGYQYMGNINFKFTDKQKKIAGYKCNHAILNFPDSQKKPIEIYYTEGLDLKSPNQNNPFREINGVLMEFTVKLMGVNMKFRTKKVTSKDVKLDLFNIPKGFKRVSLQEMEKIIKDFNLTTDK
jgi:GLPGLI family protein